MSLPFRRLAAAATAAALLPAVAATVAQAAPAPPAPDVRSGTLVRVVADDFSAGTARERLGLQEPGTGRFSLLQGVGVRDAAALIGRRVTVHGTPGSPGRLVVADGGLTVADGGTQGSTSAASPPSEASATTAAAPTTKDVAVVLVTFADNPTRPLTVDGVRTTMFTSPTSVNAYYQDVSDGALSLTGDVLDYVTVSRTSTTTCDYAAWGNAARTAVAGRGTDLSGYDHVVFVWPAQSACGWSGMGQLPGTTAWINGTPTLRLLAHELGHNFGEHHASSARCTENGAAVAIPGPSASCTLTEYGDPFTVMGASSTYLHHNAAREHYGYLSALTVAPGVDTTVTLVPADTTTGTRLVRVPRGDGSFLALEFRQPTGAFDTFASTAPVANGVTVRIDYDSGSTQTRLLDATPETSSFSDAPLLAGRSLTDPRSTATLSVLSTSAGGAQVAVTWGSGPSTPPADTTPPTAVTGLRASVAKNRTVKVTWDAATDDVGVTGYLLARTGASERSLTSTSYSERLSPGSYTYTVRARDAAGNVSAPSSVTVTVR